MKDKENPCWDGYKMIGQKNKDGKKVPNCVPKKTFKEFVEEQLNEEKKPYKGYNPKKNHKEGGLKPSYAKKLGIHAGVETKNEAKKKGGFSKLSNKTQKRRKSFCARMCKAGTAKSRKDPKSKQRAALRVWGCRCHENWERDGNWWTENEFSIFEWQKAFNITNSEVEKVLGKSNLTASSATLMDERRVLEYAHDKFKNAFSFKFKQIVGLIKNNEGIELDDYNKLLNKSSDAFNYLLSLEDSNDDFKYFYLKSGNEIYQLLKKHNLINAIKSL